MERRKKTQLKRKFTGKLTDFQSKRERNFSKKALKAYIKGKQRFRYGSNIKGEPQWYPVPQEFE
jgi:hypothetical protein